VSVSIPTVYRSSGIHRANRNGCRDLCKRLLQTRHERFRYAETSAGRTGRRVRVHYFSPHNGSPAECLCETPGESILGGTSKRTNERRTGEEPRRLTSGGVLGPEFRFYFSNKRTGGTGRVIEFNGLYYASWCNAYRNAFIFLVVINRLTSRKELIFPKHFRGRVIHPTTLFVRHI